MKRTIRFSKTRNRAERELSLRSLFRLLRRILPENLLLTSDWRTRREFSGQLHGETTESNAILSCRLFEQRRGSSLSFLFFLMFSRAKIALLDYVIPQLLLAMYRRKSISRWFRFNECNSKKRESEKARDGRPQGKWWSVNKDFEDLIPKTQRFHRSFTRFSSGPIISFFHYYFFFYFTWWITSRSRSKFREPFRLHIVSTALFQLPDAEKLHLYPLRAANVISIMANEQTATD